MFGCGKWEERIYILQQFTCCMFGVNRLKSIVIFIHNALLAMHHMHATKYFLWTSLRVEKLLPSNVAASEISSNLDLLLPSMLLKIWWTIMTISFVSGMSRISLLMSNTTYVANCSATQTHGHLYIPWQHTTSKSLYYQQRLTRYSWFCWSLSRVRKLQGHWGARSVSNSQCYH